MVPLILGTECNSFNTAFPQEVYFLEKKVWLLY